MKKTADIVIIGGGVIGTAIAYYLAREGITDTVLVEASHLAAGGTGVVLGLAAVVLLLGGGLHLHVRGMAAVVFGQTAWCRLVAAWMLRAGARARQPAEIAA